MTRKEEYANALNAYKNIDVHINKTLRLIGISAIAKQIPKKVVNFEKACDTYGDCPRCGESHWFEGDDSFNYCPDCGQALDWSEEE